MLATEVARRILFNLLETVQNIADKEYQKRVWIRGEGPEIDDFTETACRFSEDIDLVLENRKKCSVTESQCQILEKFRDRLDIFYYQCSYEPAFIDTPEWNEITEMAKEVLRAFGYPITKTKYCVTQTIKMRKHILNVHLTNVHHFSDKEYQRRVWISGSEPESDNFTTTERFFLSEVDNILRHYESYLITDEQQKILLKFRNQLSDFLKSNNNLSEFIDTPEWDEIVKMAKEVLHTFNYQSKPVE